LIDIPDFAEDKMKEVSEATYFMSIWVRAVAMTYDALLIVDPKRKELEEAEKKLAEAEKNLA